MNSFKEMLPLVKMFPLPVMQPLPPPFPPRPPLPPLSLRHVRERKKKSFEKQFKFNVRYTASKWNEAS